MTNVDPTPEEDTQPYTWSLTLSGLATKAQQETYVKDLETVLDGEDWTATDHPVEANFFGTVLRGDPRVLLKPPPEPEADSEPVASSLLPGPTPAVVADSQPQPEPVDHEALGNEIASKVVDGLGSLFEKFFGDKTEEPKPEVVPDTTTTEDGVSNG